MPKPFLASTKISLADLALGDLIYRLVSRRKKRFAGTALLIKSDDYIGQLVMADGVYERHLLDTVRQLKADGVIGDGAFLDIGANIGNHSVYLSDLFAATLCFEPNPRVFAILDCNRQLLGRESVRTFNFGLGDVSATMTLDMPDPDNLGSGKLVAGNGQGSIRVENGDAAIADISSTLPEAARKISFIKCDVEGMEPVVFRGLLETLKNHQPAIMFESNSGPAGAETWAVLQQAGYTKLYEYRTARAIGPGKPLAKALHLLFNPRKGFVEGPVPAHAANLLALP